MTKTASLLGVIAISLFVLLQAGAAEALSPRTWVSGAGADSGACTRAAPCATFDFAYGMTSAGGEIDVLTGGDFGSLAISHSLTIANDGAGSAAITPGGTSFLINAGPNDAIVLRGLTLNGVVALNAGIIFNTAASVLIDHCNIQAFQANPAIWFNAVAPTSRLWVTDSVLSNDGTSATGSILIKPVMGAAATVHLERVQILNAIGNGVRVDGTGGGGAVDVEMHDVVVDGAAGSGIVAVSATSGGPTVNIMADDVTASHNNGFGLRAVGGTASIKLRRSTVTDNVRGIGVSSGGALVSYADNSITDNINGDGDPTSTLPLR